MAQWIKPDININFNARFRSMLMLSGVLMVVSIGALIFNVAVRGSALNYSTDFKGGSEIQVEFSKAVSAAEVRKALSNAGFKGAEVVKVTSTDRDNFYMLRLDEVSAFGEAEQEKVQKGLEAAVKEGNLTRFDYKNGSDKVYLHFKRGLKVDSEQIKAVFKAANVEVQQLQVFGRSEDNVFEVILAGLDRSVRELFSKALGAGVVKDVPQVESVGAKMGRQLRDDGIKSVVYALLLMLVYIAFRFDFRFAPGAVVALTHDVILTVGIFAITWQNFSLTVIAALLTIAGYSVNDTIVIYDRIRENMAKLRDRQFPLVVNASLNETLSRTLLTSLTTLFTCVSIWVFGTGVLRTFAFALTLGVVAGTYSTLFVASPMVIYLNQKFAKKSK